MLCLRNQGFRLARGPFSLPLHKTANLRRTIPSHTSVIVLQKPKFFCSPPPLPAPKFKLPVTIRKYGPTFLALSLVIAPSFLLITYVAVSAGLMHHLALYFPTLATPQYQTAGSFAVALLIHKMWSPIRISFIVMITPYVAQMTKENSSIARILDNIVETVPFLKTVRDVWWVQFLDKIQMSKLQEEDEPNQIKQEQLKQNSNDTRQTQQHSNETTQQQEHSNPSRNTQLENDKNKQTKE